jgi:hypothetical protein
MDTIDQEYDILPACPGTALIFYDDNNISKVEEIKTALENLHYNVIFCLAISPDAIIKKRKLIILYTLIRSAAFPRKNGYYVGKPHWVFCGYIAGILYLEPVIHLHQVN